MPRETTLDAFAGSTEYDEGVETVMVWRPSGTPCADCGQPVSRLWRDDGDLLCEECTSWNRS